MKMVNTSLLAIAAGALISPALMAADVETPSDELFYSDEYLSTAAADDTVDSGVLAVTLEAEYTDDDVITWDISGSAIEAGFTGTVSSACIPSAGEPGDATLGTAGLTFGILNSDADGAQYRVTIIDGDCDADGVVTTGATVTFATALTLDAQSVDSANTITASYSAATETGTPLDTGGDDSVDLVVTGSQFAASVSPPANEQFDGIVDVNDDRLTFEGGEEEDEVTWTVDDDVCPDDIAAAGDCTFADPVGVGVDQEVTVEADWSWVVDDDPATTDEIELADDDLFVFSLGCSFVGLTATELTVDCDFGTNTITVDTSLNDGGPENTEVLPKTPFVGSHVLNFQGIGATDSSVTVAPVDLGRWLLNGFQSDLSYTPFGAGIGQVIYLANRGLQSGDVTVDYVDQDGNAGTLGVIATLEATSTLSIGALIQAALPANLRTFGRLALTVTANVPACDVQINAQYNASGNRAYTSSRDNCTEEGGTF